MYFLVGCQFIIVLAMASTPAASRLNTMVVNGNPNQRFVNEHSNRRSGGVGGDLEFLDYINPKEKRKNIIDSSWNEEMNPEQRSISMTLERLLIERQNANSSFDYQGKKQEITATTVDTNYRKTDDRRSRFFVNQMLERERNEERPLTSLNERSVTENRKELLHSEALSLKKRATGNSTPESSSRKETTEILNRKIDVRSHSTPDLQDKEPTSQKNIKENRQQTSDLFELHQQTTNSKPIRTQHLQSSREENSSNGPPEALPLYRSNSRRQQTKHLLTPLSVKRRKSRFSRQNSAALAYHQRGLLRSLQIDDHSTKMSSFFLPNHQQQLNINSNPINHIREGSNFDSVVKENFRQIPSKQVAFIPPKIIYETRILPAPFMTDDQGQKNYPEFSNFFTQFPELGGNFDFVNSDGQQSTLSPIKDEIPVTEKSAELETSFTTGPSSQVSLPPIANEISNHRYEAALPIIKSVPLNHKLHNENVDETEGTPAQLEYTGVTSEFSQKEYTHNSNSGNTYAGVNGGKYNFGYRVSDHETGNDFGHEEQRDGDLTRGRYHVLLPDGRIQNVKYHVDNQGYHAKVSYHYDH